MISSRLVLILLVLTFGGPLLAQATYQSLSQKAAQLLVEHQRDKANGVKVSYSERDKASQAGDVWLEAAKVAPADPQRFAAYESAGQAYGQSQTLADDAAKAYALARDVASVSDEERARAGLEVARRTRKREDYEVITTLLKATPQQLGQAYHEIGLSYIVPAKAEPALNLKVAEGYEQAAAQWAKSDPRRADAELGMAQVTAESLPTSQAVSVLDRLYKAQLALPTTAADAPLHQAYIRNRWGSSLLKVKATARAIDTWKAVGGNVSYPLEEREQAWLKAADAQLAEGRTADALTSLEAATPLRADNYIFSEKIAEKKLAILQAQKRTADIVAVLRALAKHPKASPQRKEQLEIEEAKQLFALGKASEAAALLTPLWAAPKRAGATICDIATIRAEAAYSAGDPAKARKEIDAGVARARELGDSGAVVAMLQTSANLHGLQKEYPQALADYAAACQTSNGYLPSKEIVDAVRSLFTQSLKAEKYPDSQTIMATVATWSVHPILVPMMKVEYYAATGDAAAARQAAVEARAQLGSFYGDNRTALEKEIQKLEASIR